MFDIEVNQEQNFDAKVTAKGDFQVLGSRTDNSNVDDNILQDIAVTIYSRQSDTLLKENINEIESTVTNFFDTYGWISSISVNYSEENENFDVSYTKDEDALNDFLLNFSL